MGNTVPGFYVSDDGDDANSGLNEGSPFKTLARAYGAALAHPTLKRVVVLSNHSEPGLVTLDPTSRQVSGDTPVLITGKSKEVTLSRNGGYNDSVIAILGGAKVAFENITVSGKRTGAIKHRALLIGGNETEVTLGKGTVITGAKRYDGSSTYYYGFGIWLYGSAKLIMKGNSAVTGCETNVYVHGAVAVENASLEISEDASVSENSCEDIGGSNAGVYLVSGTVTMTGGKISGNIATKSGGVYVAGGTFTMEGGEISYNRSTNIAGGVHINGGTFNMAGGEIRGNVASSGGAGTGGGVYVSSGTFNMTGGIIYGTNASDTMLKNISGTGAAFYKDTNATVTPAGLDTRNETFDMRPPS
jgi:hypothetical protein